MLLDRTHAPVILHREAFDIVGRKHRKVPAVITRAWLDTTYASEWDIPMTRAERARRWEDMHDGNTLNFSKLLQTVRYLEQGKHHAMLLGQTAWDIIADINNADITIRDPEYMISWTPWIHNNFRNGELRRNRAAERLQIAYSQLADVALPHTVLVEA